MADFSDQLLKYEFLIADNKFLTPARESSHKCPNIRCSYEGRCVGAKRVCDRIVDCLSAEDEIDCRLSELNFEEDENKLDNEHYELNKPLDEIRIQNCVTKSNRTISPSTRQVWNNSNQPLNIHQFQSVSRLEEPFSGIFRPNSTSNPGSSLNDEAFMEKRETASYFNCQK